MATLKDIADQCNLSVSLVSKVLNNRMGTSSAKPEVAQAIRRAARELGYRKNVSADALRRGRHDLIGVLMHRPGTVGSGLLENLIHGISAELTRNHQRQAVSFCMEDAEFVRSVEQFHAGTVDGLIAAGVRHNRMMHQLKVLNNAGLPVVTSYDDFNDQSDFVNINLDNRRPTYLATEHLIKQGCRRIAHIHTWDSRTAGFLQAMRDGGVPVDKNLVLEAGEYRFDWRAGAHAAQALLGDRARFDGVVAQSDEQSMGVLQVLLAAGVRVPEDVKLIGIDNSPYCEFAAVPLSSVSQEPHQRGCMAVQALNRLLAGGKVVSLEVTPRVIVRQSTS